MMIATFFAMALAVSPGESGSSCDSSPDAHEHRKAQSAKGPAALTRAALTACLLSLDQLRLDATLVDERAASQQNLARLPGSVESPELALAAKADGQIVLIGDGTTDIDLLVACQGFRQASGADIRVLIGGTRTLATSSRLMQRAAGAGDLDVVDHGQVVRLMRQPDVSVIDLSGENGQVLADILGELRRPTDRGQLGTERRMVLPTLYVIPSGESARRWRTKLGLRATDNVFFYNQGLARLGQYIEHGLTITVNAGRGLPTSCGWNG